MIDETQNGFTLMEILFALTLFGVAAASLFPAFLGHIKFNNFSEVRSGAYSAAQIVLDELRLEDPADMPSSGSDSAVSVQVGTRTYSVIASYCRDNTFCGTDTRFITIEVSYYNEEVYEVSTVYTQLR